MDEDDPFNYSTIEIPTVVGLLKNVLTQYPDNGQILKELVQNAEDAGATTFEVVHDTRKRRLDNRSVKRFIEGPALFVYNNAVFTDGDWHGIRMLSDSIKRDDLLKVGQFGLGFKSVFHFTDFVTIISGTNVLFMDPSEPEARMCRDLPLARLSKVIPVNECLDLWGIYLQEEHLRDGHIPGTIIWFPLRREESKLSSTVYEQRNVERLFESFSVEARLCLTFLKSLENISIRKVEESAKSDILKVSLSGTTLLETQQRRKAFKKQLEICKGFPDQALTCKYDITVDTCNQQGFVSQQIFKILHYLPCTPQDKRSAHMPLVGVAAPMPPIRRDAKGHIFCFLPLPLESANSTNLPVEVHGYFVLDQNRRHVKWKTEESSSEPDVIWNESLVKNILTDAYFHILQDILDAVKTQSVSIDAWYNLLPNVTSSTSANVISGRWMALSQKIWSELLQGRYPIIYSTVKKEMMCPGDVISTANLDKLPKPVGKSVRAVLEDVGLPLATIPESIETTLCSMGTAPKSVTPRLLRDCLKNNGIKDSWNRLHLLEYVLSDNQYEDLNGIQLVPLESGHWSIFSNSGETVYVCTQEDAAAFVGVEERLLSTSLRSEVSTHLHKLAEEGITTLCKFSPRDHATELLRVSVSYIQKNSFSHPQLRKWLEKVWSLLNHVDLQEIENLMLIPTTENFTATDLISLSSAIILKDLAFQVPEACIEALGHLEIKVLPTLPNYVRHPDLHHYFFGLDAKGVEQSLEKLICRHHDTSDLVNTFNGRVTDGQRIAFCNKVGELERVKPEVKNFLKRLCLFKAVWRDKVTSVCVENLDKVYPIVEDFPVGSPEPLIIPYNLTMQSLVLKLGATQLSIEELCILVLQNTYSECDTEKLGWYILNDRNLCRSANILRHLKNVRFISSSCGQLCIASELYDPFDLHVDALLGEGLTPGKQYREYNSVLKYLGLKAVLDMPKEGIIKIMKGVSTKQLCKSDRLVKIESLFKVINSRFDCKHICQELKNVKCIYGVSSRPSKYPSNLMWATRNVRYEPCQVSSLHFKDVVGSLVPLVDCGGIPNVASGFGWNEEPSVDNIIEHLENVIQVFPALSNIPGIITDPNNLPLQTVRSQSKEYRLNCESMQQSAELLKRVCFEIYSYFDYQVRIKKLDMSNLWNKKMLLTKKYGFVEPLLFAQDVDIECAPALFSVQREGLGHYEHMMKSLGVRQHFPPRTVYEILIKKKNDFQTDILPEEEIILISKLFNLLFRVRKDIGSEKMSLADLCLPDSRGVLCPVGDLCVDDGNQMKNSRFNFMHEKVSYSQKMLRWLGIEEKTRKRFLDSSRRMKFGQKEPLTIRLKGILDNYPCDSGIMKELLQNADDAGATEIAFIKDFRNHPTEKLFDKGWAPLQGPALCVYNNRGFKERDLEGIQSLGNSSKIHDPTSTGQYGIGFNAVYHLTDAPSFITRGKEIPGNEVLCMFDPHCMYDPNATKESPGIQLTDLDHQRRVYPDSFKGYWENLLKEEGTVFRLPLRTCEDSKIGKVMSKFQLVELLDEFKSDVKICLLFLRNVRKITLYTVKMDGGLLVDYSVESHIPDEGKLVQLAEFVKDRKSRSNYYNLPFFLDMQRVSYEVQIKDSDNREYRWLLAHQFGSENSGSLPELVLKAFKEECLKLLPQAGVALLLASSESVNDKFFKNFCYLPLPAQSGFPLCLNGHFALDNSRRDMWKGSGDFKTVWNEWLMEQVMAPIIAEGVNSYRTLIFPPDKELSLEEYNFKVKGYYNVLPDYIRAESDKWKKLVTWFYQYVNKQELPLVDVYVPESDIDVVVESRGIDECLPSFLRGQTKQVTPKSTKGRLLWHAFVESNTKFRVCFDRQGVGCSMRGTLKRLGMKLGSDHMFKKLEGVEMDIDLLNAESVVQFLLSWNQNFLDRCQPAIMSKVDETPFLSVENLCNMFKYISSVGNFSRRLNGVPLLVTGDSILRPFDDQHTVYVTKHGKLLLPELEHEFVHLQLFEVIKQLNLSVKDMNMIDFTLDDFASKLPLVLDQKYKDQIPLGGCDDCHGEAWIQNVWNYIVDEVKRKCNLEQRLRETGKQYLLNTLGDWALYPVTHQKTKYLVPVKYASRVLYVDSDDPSIYHELPVPHPYPRIFIPESLQLAATLRDPTALLGALFHCRKELANIVGYKKLDLNVVLEYFGRHCNTSQLSVSKLKCLKIYKDAAGAPCTLEQDFISISSSVASLDSIQKLGAITGTVILNPVSKSASALFKYLNPNCCMCNLDIYTKFILPNLKLLPESEYTELLEFLRCELDVTYLKQRGIWTQKEVDVVSKLKRTAFISMNGQFATASQFYVPYHPVFAVMERTNLPKKWAKREWRKFLYLAGVVRSVSGPMIMMIIPISLLVIGTVTFSIVQII